MINNKTTGRCPMCGGPADVTVHADGFDDTPPSFTMRITCKGRCVATRIPMTPQQMHETTKLPLNGWDNAKY